MHNSAKDHILEITDIVDVIGERVALTRKGKDFVGLCPFHPDHNPSMSVSSKKQIFKCWSCGAGGDVIKYVQLRERVEFAEALAILARRAGIELSPQGGGRVNTVNSQAKESLRKVLEWARDHFARNLHSSEGRSAMDYARRRGLSEEMIERARLGYAPDRWDDLISAATKAGVSPEMLEQAGLTSRNEKGRVYDRFRDRLIFPIADAMGRPVAFGGRTLSNDPAKYLNSPESPVFSKSRILFGLDLAKDAVEKVGQAVIVEGYLDAVLLHQYGFQNVVATLGTALTDAHVKQLKPLTERLTFCFDSDTAGIKAADRAVETALRHKIEVRVVGLAGGKDPADLVVAHGAAAFEQQLQSAVDALEFKWLHTFRESGGTSPAARRNAAEAMIDFAAAVSGAGGIDPLEQGMLVSRLADLLTLPVETVHELLTRARRRKDRTGAVSTVADVGGKSTYDLAVQGLPTGIVAAVEEMFAHMIQNPGEFGWGDDVFAEAVGYCEPWRSLDTTARELHEEFGAFGREDLLARCDDAVLLDLIERVSRRGVLSHAAHEIFDLNRARLAIELDALHMEQMRGQLRSVKSESEGEQMFRSALDAACRQKGFGWSASSGVSG